MALIIVAMVGTMIGVAGVIRIAEGEHIAGLGRTVRQKARNAGQNEAEKREEYDCLGHDPPQPFITLMSSTAIEPRLRK